MKQYLLKSSILIFTVCLLVATIPMSIAQETNQFEREALESVQFKQFEHEEYIPPADFIIEDSGTSGWTTVTYNEFEYIQELSKLSSQELKKSNFSSSEIKAIQSYESKFMEHLESLSVLSDEELTDLGYSEEKIENLRNLDSNNIQSLAEFGAQCSVSVRADWMRGIYANGTKETTVILYYDYSWDDMPLTGLQDVIGIAWDSQPYTLKKYPSHNTTLETWYWNQWLDRWTLYNSNNWSTPTLNNTSYWNTIRFDSIKSGNLTTPNNGPGYAREGGGSMRLYCAGHMPSGGDLDIYVIYGHQVLGIAGNFGVSFSTSGASAGFTFNPITDVVEFVDSNNYPYHIDFP